MKTALIIIDIQNDYFENGAMSLVSSLESCSNAKLLLERFRQESLAVIHIQHIATRADAKFFLSDTIGVDIHKLVKPLKNEPVFIKHYPNSFRETGLLEYLNNNSITDLVVCGMMTHVCVDSTVRAAKDFGFNCTVIGDSCATKDLEFNVVTISAENVQKSFLAALNYFYSTVKTTKQFLEEYVF